MLYCKNKKLVYFGVTDQNESKYKQVSLHVKFIVNRLALPRLLGQVFSIKGPVEADKWAWGRKYYRWCSDQVVWELSLNVRHIDLGTKCFLGKTIAPCMVLEAFLLWQYYKNKLWGKLFDWWEGLLLE